MQAPKIQKFALFLCWLVPLLVSLGCVRHLKFKIRCWYTKWRCRNVRSRWMLHKKHVKFLRTGLCRRSDWGGTREGVRQFAEVDGTSVSVVLVVSERGSELVVVLELVVLVVSERGSEQRIPCPLGITGSRWGSREKAPIIEFSELVSSISQKFTEMHELVYMNLFPAVIIWQIRIFRFNIDFLNPYSHIFIDLYWIHFMIAGIILAQRS